MIKKFAYFKLLYTKHSFETAKFLSTFFSFFYLLFFYNSSIM